VAEHDLERIRGGRLGGVVAGARQKWAIVLAHDARSIVDAFPPREGSHCTDAVAHPKRVAALTPARRQRPYVELAFWTLAILLISPLLIYYRAGVMPLAALFAIAAGIALGLALTGRRLHGVLLDDAMSARAGKGRFLMTFGMALLLLFLVLLGSVVALLFLLRQGTPKLPV
jgi:hypothetical protein